MSRGHRARLSAVPVVLLVAFAAASCGGDAPADAAAERCDIPFTVPAGFEVTGGIEDPYDDRIGVRVDMERDAGQELHYFAGIAGEFGEGLPAAGLLATAGGRDGTLLGRDEVWVFHAGTGGGCAETAVLGSGMSRRSFVELLREVGAVAE